MTQNVRPRVPWLRRDQWVLFSESYADPAELHGSYDEWRVDTENSIQDLRRAGVSVLRVDVDILEWVAWCEAERRTRDAQALLLFTMKKAPVV